MYGGLVSGGDYFDVGDLLVVLDDFL